MNRGVETTQRSLEITQVRESMNDQAAVLRYAQQDNGMLWRQLIAANNTEGNASQYGILTNGRCPTTTQQLGASHPFVVDPQTMQIEKNNILTSQSSVAYPQIVSDAAGGYQGSDGLWVEAEAHIPQGYVDFHIRACWDAPGSNIPSTLGTIVRLYVQ